MPEFEIPSPTADTLLVDAGNSQVKWVWAHGRQLLAETLQQGSAQDLESYLNDLAQAAQSPQQQLLVASVTAELNIPEVWQSRLKTFRSPAQHSLLKNAYPEPDKLGVDRWLAMLGARLCCSETLCVVDFGTATTLDAVDEQGQHLGGWIIPGLATSRRALQRKGHLLKVDLDGAGVGRQSVFANNTPDAIAGGTLQLQVAAVERFLTQIKAASHSSPRLFLTGGWAQAVAGLLSYEAIIDPLLVFRGILAQHHL